MDIIGLLSSKPKTDFKVKVSDGNQARTYDVSQIVAYNEGFALRYKDKDGNKDVVYMSRNYRPLMESGCYIVGKNLGNNSAAVMVDGVKLAVGCDVVGRSTDADCPGEDLSAIIRSDGLAIGYKALYESKIPWKLLLIAVSVVVVIIVLVTFVRSQGA